MEGRTAPKFGSQGSPRLSPRVSATALSDPWQLSPRDPTPCTSGKSGQTGLDHASRAEARLSGSWVLPSFGRSSGRRPWGLWVPPSSAESWGLWVPSPSSERRGRRYRATTAPERSRTSNEAHLDEPWIHEHPAFMTSDFGRSRPSRASRVAARQRAYCRRQPGKNTTVPPSLNAATNDLEPCFARDCDNRPRQCQVHPLSLPTNASSIL